MSDAEKKAAANQKLEDLSQDEQKLLQKCESAIASSEKSYIAVGEALLQIREQKLYKAKHSSFDSYCETKWGFSGSHAHRLIESAELVAKLRKGEVPEEQLPRNEYQARLLMGGREAKHQVRTWKKILKLANNSVEGITPKLMAGVLKNKEEESSGSEKKPDNVDAANKPVTSALKLIEGARKRLKVGKEQNWKTFLDELEMLLKQLE